MTDLKWETPPNHGNTKTDWNAIAASLRSRPGEWANVGRYVASHRQAIRAGAKVAFRPVGSFETRASNGDGRTFDLYVRFVGVSA